MITQIRVLSTPQMQPMVHLLCYLFGLYVIQIVEIIELNFLICMKHKDMEATNFDTV